MELNTAKRVKANAPGIKTARPDIKVVPRNRFRSYETLEEIFTVLFGRKPSHSSVTP